MKLYTVTIAGKKFYFTGDLTPSVYDQIDSFCKHNSHHSDYTQKQRFDILMNYIKKDLHQLVEPLCIERVFRIN